MVFDLHAEGFLYTDVFPPVGIGCIRVYVYQKRPLVVNVTCITLRLEKTGWNLFLAFDKPYIFYQFLPVFVWVIEMLFNGLLINFRR